MRFLYTHAIGKNREAGDIVQSLRRAGHEAIEYDKIIGQPWMLDDIVMSELGAFIRDNRIDILISIHFIINVALTAYRNHVKYIALLWDAPFMEVYSPMGKLDNVYISTFDKLDKQRFLDFGAKHVIYQPLCINAELFEEWIDEIQETLHGNYFHDISFIGQLYDSNPYDIHLDKIPMNMRYYFNSIFEEAAFKWDGVNRIYGKTSKEILEYIKLASPDFGIPDQWELPEEEYFERICLVKKVANIERVAVLNLLAEEHNVMLYTGRRKAAEETLHRVGIGPGVVSGKATSLVYAGSKINLNIQLKGIEQGTPQRIMDIMGSGGFALSAWCPETAELFEEDKEIVFFRTPEELLEKVDYYLAHEEERRQIAKAGHAKAVSCYTYDRKIRELLAWMGVGG